MADVREAALKVALVTGGGGGLGRSIALELAARGQSVFIADIDRAGLDETRRLAAATGALLTPIEADLSDALSPAQVIGKVLAAEGRIDILVNNAAVTLVEPFLGMTARVWDKTWEINVRAVALMTAACAEAMRERRSGRIVNITSPASKMALPQYTAYAASKAAVDAITRCAAVALAPSGITVNSVAPGMMDTPMQVGLETTLARLEGRADLEAFMAERTKRIPLGRRAEISEVAAAVVWLALDAPHYVTGERLNVTGGMVCD